MCMCILEFEKIEFLDSKYGGSNLLNAAARKLCSLIPVSA